LRRKEPERLTLEGQHRGRWGRGFEKKTKGRDATREGLPQREKAKEKDLLGKIAEKTRSVEVLPDRQTGENEREKKRGKPQEIVGEKRSVVGIAGTPTKSTSSPRNYKKGEGSEDSKKKKKKTQKGMTLHHGIFIATGKEKEERSFKNEKREALRN